MAFYVLGGILLLGALVIGAVMVALQRRRAKREDPLVTEWRRFCGKFARVGLERRQNEGPIDFAGRAATRFPKNTNEIQKISESYALLRYGLAAERKARHEFRQLVRGFSINDSSRSNAS